MKPPMLQSSTALALCAALAFGYAQAQDKPAADARAAAAKPGKPALSVMLIQPQARDVPLRLVANGSVNAWQEAILGAEANGLRLREVRAEVGAAVDRKSVV